jgi:predicted NodU family carbamoyl transferase
MIVVGISAYYDDSAAALVRDGGIVKVVSRVFRTFDLAERRRALA